MKKLMVIGFVGVVFVLAAIVLTGRRAASVPRATITFIGYTNGSAGTRLAMFRIVNNGRETIRRLSGCHREEKIWSTYGYSHTVGSKSFVRPGRSEVVLVVAPLHQTAWRQVFYFSEASLKRRLNDALQNTELLRRFSKPMPEEHIKSDWIEN